MVKKIVLHLLTAFVLFMLACGGDPIPVREMTDAKVTITKAQKYNASEFAREQYGLAIKYIMDAHSNIENGKLEDAEHNAELAKKHALLALNEAAPKMVDSSIVDAKDAIARAEEANAEEFAPDQFTRAQVEARQAELHLDAKKFDVARESAVSAISSAEDARTVSLAKKGIIKDALIEVKSTLVKAKGYSADTDEPEKFKTTLTELKKAAAAYKSGKLKESYTSVKSAKVTADELYLAAAQKASIKNINLATTQLKKAKKSSGAKSAKDELAASGEMLASARTQHGDTLFEESINSSNESLRLSTLVLGTAPVADPDPAPMDMSGKHKVKRNEFLRKLAQRFYRDEKKWRLIYKANKDKIKNPDLIFPNMILDIPEASSSVEDFDSPVEPMDDSTSDDAPSSDYISDDVLSADPSAEVSEEETVEVLPE